MEEMNSYSRVIDTAGLTIPNGRRKIKTLWYCRITLQFLPSTTLCLFDILENMYIKLFSKCMPEPIDNTFSSKKGNSVIAIVIKNQFLS